MFTLIGKLMDLVILPIDILADWLRFGKEVSDNEIKVQRAEYQAKLADIKPLK